MNTPFFKDPYQDLRNLPPERIREKIDLMRQISNQLREKLENYNHAVHEGFNLLWEKQHNYTQLLSGLLQAPPLDAEQLTVIDKKIEQFQYTIQELTTLLSNENSNDVLSLYELHLENINYKINELEKLI